MWRIRVYFKIGKSVDKVLITISITYMKHIIIHTYMVASVIAIALLHNDLKDTSEALENTQSILDYHQKALESHKVVIQAHDTVLGLMMDHLENSFL